MMKKIYLGILVLGLLSSCQMGKNYFVDFDDVESAPGMFRVVRQQNTDMEELVANGGLRTMGGDVLDVTSSTGTEEESGKNGPNRASSVTMANMMQRLVDFSCARHVFELSGL